MTLPAFVKAAGVGIATDSLRICRLFWDGDRMGALAPARPVVIMVSSANPSTISASIAAGLGAAATLSALVMTCSLSATISACSATGRLATTGGCSTVLAGVKTVELSSW